MSKTNHVHLIGRFGQDPKLLTTEDQKMIVTFSFATHDKRKTAAGEWEDHSEWHNIVSFGNDAKIIHEYMRKGSQAAITGRLQTRQYVDKNQQQRYVTEIVLEDILFLHSPSDNQGSTN